MTNRRPASIRDVAKAARVSTATVSRVLNRPDLVAPETAGRVQIAIQELSYHPNIFAQGLMTRKSRLLALALPDIHGEFYSEILRGADIEARRQGYHLLVTSDVNDGDGGLVTNEAAGLIGGLAVMVTEPNQQLWREARDASIPVVVIDRDVHEAGVDSVVIDNAKGTREAAEHLLQSVAPERCYFIGGPERNFDTAQRAETFAGTLRARGVNVRPDQRMFREYSADWGERCGYEIIKRGVDKPVGILAANDEIAYGALRAAQQMNIPAPFKIRVVGFDDTRLASLVLPRLSTVRVPRAEVGQAAVSTLIRRLQSPDADALVTRLETTLVIRDSSVPDPGVR